MNGSIASANNATLATVAANYGLKTVVLPGHSGEDHAAGGLQASKADASALTAYALQSAVGTSSKVGSKILAALLDAVTTAAGRGPPWQGGRQRAGRPARTASRCSTSSQVDPLLEDYRTGTAQDTETTSAVTAACALAVR